MKQEGELEKRCSFEMSNGEPCGRKLFDNDFCIFHSTDTIGKQDDFEEKFWIEFEKQRRESDLFNFEGFIFPNNISFTEMEIDKPISFKEAKFKDVDFNWTKFEYNVNFENVYFDGKANFNSAEFFMEVQFKSSIFILETDFKGTIFKGMANFYNTGFEREGDFSSANFLDEIDFSHSSFAAKGDFNHSIIRGEATFHETIFQKGAYFEYSEFFGKSDFSNTTFSGKPGETLFREANFKEKLILAKATFSGEVDFTDIKTVDIDISNVRFCDKAVFKGSILSGNINFKDVKFLSDVVFANAKLGIEDADIKIDFNNVQFKEGGDFYQVIFLSDNLDFNNAGFSGKETNFKEAEFGCQFVDFSGTRFQSVNTYFDNARFQVTRISLTEAFFKNVYGLFELLDQKKNYMWFFKKRDYLIDNFKFTVGEESLSRYPIIGGMIKDAWYYKRLKDKSPPIYAFMKITTNLNTSIKLFIMWCILITLIFGCIYYNAFFHSPQVFNFSVQTEPRTFISFLYYSVVTFSTLGFGDIIPTREWLQFVVIIEVMFGYLMLGFLINLLSNYVFSRRT